MINFFKFYIVVFLCLICLSCSTKTEKDDRYLGMRLVDRAINYQLQGSKRMASYAYNRAISKFRDMSSFCNMARVAILMVTIDPEESLPLLEDARAFAAIGECLEETNIINFLSGNDYDDKKLPSPYNNLSKFYKTGNINYLLSIAKSSSTSEPLRSHVYRQIANHIVDSNPQYALELIDKVSVIDSKRTWTLNLVKDERIRLKAIRNLGLSEELTIQKLKILEQALNEKY